MHSHTIKHTKHIAYYPWDIHLGFVFSLFFVWGFLCWCSRKWMSRFTLTNRFCGNFYVIITVDKDKRYLHTKIIIIKHLTVKERGITKGFICHCYSNLWIAWREKNTFTSIRRRFVIPFDTFLQWNCIFFLSPSQSSTE